MLLGERLKRAMRILLLGATGRTGQMVLRRCEELGYQVVTYGRHEGGGSHSLTDDLNDVAAFRAASRDVNAVISCLASSNAQPVCSQATQSLIAAVPGGMRYVVVSGASIEMVTDVRTFFNRLLIKALHLFMGRMLVDRQAELDMLMASDLAWTVLRPPRLTNGEGKGDWTFDQGKPSVQYITRADLAHAVVTTLTRDDLIRQAPFVSAAVYERIPILI